MVITPFKERSASHRTQSQGLVLFWKRAAVGAAHPKIESKTYIPDYRTALAHSALHVEIETDRQIDRQTDRQIDR